MFNYIYKIKNMPLDITIFLFGLLIMTIYYFFFDYYIGGLFSHYGFTMASLSNPAYIGVTLFLYLVLLIGLFLVFYGFVNRTEWARKFTIIFVIWAAIWPLWGFIVGNNIVLHLLFFIIYVLMVYYLFGQSVKEYFRLAQIYRYGDWTLYKLDVTLKNDKQVTIHFFSKHEPKNGTPTTLPEGYEVGVNERSDMPYLRKVTTSPKKSKKKPFKLIKKDSTRKPSKVIYVVSRPQPGQVKGDWAVRSHNKIFSHHRKKLNAIKAARSIAKKLNTTILIQKANGKFSRGIRFIKK